MKKSLKYVALICAIGALALSCTKEEGVKVEQTKQMTFVAGNLDIPSNVPTKTYLGEDGLTPLWSEGDQLALVYWNNSDQPIIQTVPMVSRSSDFRTATFQSNTLDIPQGVDFLYTYIQPASNKGLLEPQYYRKHLEINYLSNSGKKSQCPVSNSYDPAYDVLIGEPIDLKKADLTQPIQLRLKRPVALVKIQVVDKTTGERLKNETIKDMFLDFSTMGTFSLGGRYNYDFEVQKITTDNHDFKTTMGCWPSKPIGLKVMEPIYLFTFPMIDYTEKEGLQLDINTENYHISRFRIYTKNLGKKFTIDAGKLTTLRIAITDKDLTPQQ